MVYNAWKYKCFVMHQDCYGVPKTRTLYTPQMSTGKKKVERLLLEVFGKGFIQETSYAPGIIDLQGIEFRHLFWIKGVRF